ncbi:MAG: cupin domain-containing protein, partial [Terriglobia bacterium]
MPDSRAHRTLSKPLSSDPAFSLAWLIHPAPTQQFFASYWETQTLVVKRNQPHYYDSLLTLDAVDRALTTLDRKYPEVVLKNANLPVSENDYTLKDGSLDVARVYQLFQEGSTITLAFLDTVLPELNSFCRSLERELSFPMQANIYLTPPAGQGAKPHYDTHDVFVLQVSGSKQWTIYETPVELPLASQDFDSAIHPIGASTLEFELEAGDMAYIPRGAAHDARSTDMTSLHVTAGVLRYTWADLILEAVAGAALTDPAFRRSLPPGFARTDFDRSQAFEMFRELLRRVPAQANFDAALDRFVDEFIAACPPQLRGQM